MKASEGWRAIQRMSWAERWDVVKPWAVSVLLLPLCIQFAGVGELDILRREVPLWFYGVLNGFTLVVHEAGHVVFGLFGRFMMFAGGSLLQVILPVVFVVSFYRSDYRLGTQFSLLWLGQSLISLSIYAADGKKRILPLLGDNLDGHDWHNMLTMMGIVDAAPVFGWLFYGLALAAFGALLLAPRFMWD